jgi:hypothetical protein
MIVVWYLVLTAAWSNSTTVVPQSFETNAECRAAGETWRQESQWFNVGSFFCIPKQEKRTTVRVVPQVRKPVCPQCPTTGRFE